MASVRRAGQCRTGHPLASCSNLLMQLESVKCNQNATGRAAPAVHPEMRPIQLIGADAGAPTAFLIEVEKTFEINREKEVGCGGKQVAHQ